MSLYMYDVGEFKHRIEIQQLKTDKINGRPINKYNTILSTRAKTYKDNKTTTVEGKTIDVDTSKKRILIRTPKTFELTNDYRIIFKGKQYKIKSSDDIKELGIYTEIILERIE